MIATYAHCGGEVRNLPEWLTSRCYEVGHDVRWQCAKCRDRVVLKTPLDWRERLAGVCRGQKVRRVG